MLKVNTKERIWTPLMSGDFTYYSENSIVELGQGSTGWVSVKLIIM